MPYVYMAKNNQGKLYVGISNNPDKRLKEHNSKNGAAFTKHGVFKIIFRENHPSLAEARQSEIQIKKWSRKKEEALIDRYQQGLSTTMPKKNNLKNI